MTIARMLEEMRLFQGTAFEKLPRGTLQVPTFEMHCVDFSRYDAIATEGLDSCLAVVTCRKDLRNATMAHLTVSSDVEGYLRWLLCHSGTMDPTFIIGGRSLYDRVTSCPASYGQITKLEKALKSAGYLCHKPDVLGNVTRKVTLTRDGLMTIERKHATAFEENYMPYSTLDIRTETMHLTAPASSNDNLWEQDLGVYGVITGPDSIRFERKLPGDIDTLWSYLTDARRLRLWFVEGEIPKKVGESFLLHQRGDALPFRSTATVLGEVLAYEPPYMLSYRWQESGEPSFSTVTFALESKEDHTRLIIMHQDLSRTKIPPMLAGWHAHTRVLQSQLEDSASFDFMQFYQQMLTIYRQFVIPESVNASALNIA